MIHSRMFLVALGLMSFHLWGCATTFRYNEADFQAVLETVRTHPLLQGAPDLAAISSEFRNDEGELEEVHFDQDSLEGGLVTTGQVYILGTAWSILDRAFGASLGWGQDDNKLRTRATRVSISGDPFFPLREGNVHRFESDVVIFDYSTYIKYDVHLRVTESVRGDSVNSNVPGMLRIIEVEFLMTFTDGTDGEPRSNIFRVYYSESLGISFLEKSLKSLERLQWDETVLARNEARFGGSLGEIAE